jgi:cell division protein ZapA
MANVDIEIAARRYSVACRDGEEAHLRSVASLVDEKAQDAAGALGNLGEARQLLFASLLLADELKEKRREALAAGQGLDDGLAESLERLAERIESLASRLESEARST